MVDEANTNLEEAGVKHHEPTARGCPSQCLSTRRAVTHVGHATTDSESQGSPHSVS